MTARSIALSVVVPVLNEAGNIETCLQSLQAARQAAQVQIIVVDGGIEDGTPARAAAWCDLLLNAETGRARQMNAGLQHALGDTVLFLHADTLLPAAALTQLLQHLQQQPAVWGRFDVGLQHHKPVYALIAWMMNLRSRLSGIATGDQCMFVSRDLLQSIGGLPDIPLMEDVELSRRLRRLQAPLCLREKVFPSVRKWQRHGIWRTILLMWQLRLRYALGASPQRLHDLYYGN